MALNQEVAPTVDRSRAYAKAAQDLFANIPAKGSPRDVINTWHQLEQLIQRNFIPNPAGELFHPDDIPWLTRYRFPPVLTTAYMRLFSLNNFLYAKFTPKSTRSQLFTAAIIHLTRGAYLC